MRENTVILLHRFAWTAYVLVLIVGSLVPVDMSGAPDQSDKVFHFLAYGLMVFSGRRPGNPPACLRSGWRRGLDCCLK